MTAATAAQTAVRRRKTGSGKPTLKLERSFGATGHRYVAGCDEVGRGALAGPVTVGMVLLDVTAVRALAGVRDSKLMTPPDRVAMVPKIQRWALSWGVGHASSREIDELGLIAALRTAGTRAWEQVRAVARPDVVILDGNHDWLSWNGQSSLFDDLQEAADDAAVHCDSPVVTRIKADLQCLSVAAASVLAKVARDTLMEDYAVTHPGYGWDLNKGYATGSHRAAIDGLGPSPLHRLSWRLGGSPDRPDMPGVGVDEADVDDGEGLSDDVEDFGQGIGDDGWA